ncbi:hypothetical protein HQ535_00285 [bacterium]|nr:hypothetical protein [bacterium]
MPGDSRAAGDAEREGSHRMGRIEWARRGSMTLAELIAETPDCPRIERIGGLAK